MFSMQLLALLCLSFALIEAKSIKKSQANLLEPTFGLDEWQGKWFPFAPGQPHIPPKDVQRGQGQSNNITGWKGKWFPYVPGEPHLIKMTPEDRKEQTDPGEFGSTTEAMEPEDPNELMDDHGEWHGKWFPKTPKPQRNIPCDDGKSNLSVDYDPEDIRDSFNYLCISSNRSLYEPKLNREAILTEHFLPSAYVPPIKCLNESIDYTHLPPTNGPFRPLPAEYGSYSYLPPQRYLRNLAEGAIVMLYHPCAFSGQVKQLQDIVGGCLYRHLISPSLTLSAERPLALLAWSRSLEMSVLDNHLVSDFIQKHAKQGPLAMEELSRVVDKREKYKEGLLTEARLVTTTDDYELCGYMQEGM
ncbi:hypothetical protein KR009_000262 [Drosophila setifemur]|nr:hypothetical protein KR009_000262 [Drosophila setifemur]